MRLLNNLVAKSDSLGAISSSLCLIHCIATPFIFALQTCSIGGEHGAPLWWGIIDFLFLGISFLAIYWSAKNTSKDWMKYALWGTWAILCLVIVNEKMGFIPLMGAAIYFPAIGLVFLHIYNLKYCQCEDEQCCVEEHDVPTRAAGYSAQEVDL